MVVWLFAGGGQSEISGLVPFLRTLFPTCSFERKTPINTKSGPRPGRPAIAPSLGTTGRGLGQQIKRQLAVALLSGSCDLLLILDDLDCHNPDEMETFFLDIINEVAGASELPKVVGFAAPELESWLIADWDNAVASDIDFSRYQQDMRWWLSAEGNVPFAAPETFSAYDANKDSCLVKLSDLLITASERQVGQPRFRKAIHTPRLLQQINPETVARKCPLFRRFFAQLAGCCRIDSVSFIQQLDSGDRRVV